jgi:hypothetical protein
MPGIDDDDAPGLRFGADRARRRAAVAAYYRQIRGTSHPSISQ